jgi:hypothetical protein
MNHRTMHQTLSIMNVSKRELMTARCSHWHMPMAVANVEGAF